jgi:hypothetical protein
MSGIMRWALPLLVTLAFIGTAVIAPPQQQARAEVFDQRPGVTCVSERDPEFAEEMTDLMRIAVNVGTDEIGGVRHQPGVAFYDEVTRTECYTSRSVLFQTGSIVKALMLAALLRRPQGITDEQRPMIEALILRSVNEPESTTIWNHLGCGRDASGNVMPCTEVWDFLAAAGMHDTLLDGNGASGSTRVSAYDAVQLFKVFTSPNSLISDERRQYALGLLSRTTPRYGVTSYAPPGTTQRVKIGHKKNNDDRHQWIANAVGQVEGGPAGYNYLMSIFTEWNTEIDLPHHYLDRPVNGPARVNRIGEQINCGVRELNGDAACSAFKSESCHAGGAEPTTPCATTRPLRSHRSQNWVRVSITAPANGSTAHWRLRDAANGIVVDEGDIVGGSGCACEKTVHGLFGSYVLELVDVHTGFGMIGTVLNYTGDPRPGANQAPVVRAGPDRYGYEGIPVDLGGFVNDDQGLPEFHWTASPVDGVDPGATCTFGRPDALITTVNCTDDGTYAIHLSANDGSNDTVTDTARLTLWNTAPTLEAPPGAAATSAEGTAASGGLAAPTPWQVFRVGDPVPLEMSFQDLGSNDTHDCTIDWDDGQTQTVAARQHQCKTSHRFPQPGMYTIKSKVTDDDEDTISGSVMVIVYDPDGGFATAGGYLDSPAGALTSAPDDTNRLHLRLNPKYRPGDPGPVVGGGKVGAHLSGSPFSIDSTTLDWLVVTPAGKVAVKGTGTVNGHSGYGFIAYGYDDPDKLRLVVWELSEGSFPGTSVVYDNRRGSDYDLDLANPQALGGGSFQAHL